MGKGVWRFTDYRIDFGIPALSVLSKEQSHRRKAAGDTWQCCNSAVHDIKQSFLFPRIFYLSRTDQSDYGCFGRSGSLNADFLPS